MCGERNQKRRCSWVEHHSRHALSGVAFSRLCPCAPTGGDSVDLRKHDAVCEFGVFFLRPRSTTPPAHETTMSASVVFEFIRATASGESKGKH